MVAAKLLSVWALALGPVAALWPQPSSVETGTAALFINKDIEVTYNDARVSCHLLCLFAVVDGGVDSIPPRLRATYPER